MHRLCVTPPKTILGLGNLCPQLPSHSAPFHPFFKVSPDAAKSDLVPTLSQSNLLSSILHSHRFSPLLLKTDQLLCRIPRPAGTTAKSAATKRTSFLCTLCTSKGSWEDGATAKFIPPANSCLCTECWRCAETCLVFSAAVFPQYWPQSQFLFLWGLKDSQTSGEAEGVCYRMVCAHTGHISQVSGVIWILQ